MAQQPQCLVVMPFGVKRDALGGSIDFDLVYRVLVLPAIEQAGLVAVRAEDDGEPGLARVGQLDSLLRCERVLFDLTLPSPTLMYDLGVRHALSPSGTLVMAASTSSLPPELSAVRSLRYALNGSGKPEQVDTFQRQLSQWLQDSLSGGQPDSPVFQMLPDLQVPALSARPPGDSDGWWSATDTDLASARRAQVDGLRQRLQHNRRFDIDDLQDAAAELLALPQPPVDLLLALVDAYRRQQAWQDLVDLIGRLPAQVAAGARCQEQLALALNRLGRRREAEAVLQALITRGDATNETHALLGRVYRDIWNLAERDGQVDDARRHLEKAIDAYLRAFETDWRDPYPGLSALNLLAQLDVHDPRLAETLPVVRYGMKRRMADAQPEFWDLATTIDLAVLADDQRSAQTALRQLQALPRDTWMIDVVRNNLRLMAAALQRQQAAPAWLADLIDLLGPPAAG